MDKPTTNQNIGSSEQVIASQETIPLTTQSLQISNDAAPLKQQSSNNAQQSNNVKQQTTSHQKESIDVNSQENNSDVLYFKPKALKNIHIIVFVFVCVVHFYEIFEGLGWLNLTDINTLNKQRLNLEEELRIIRQNKAENSSSKIKNQDNKSKVKSKDKKTDNNSKGEKKARANQNEGKKRIKSKEINDKL